MNHLKNYTYQEAYEEAKDFLRQEGCRFDKKKGVWVYKEVPMEVQHALAQYILFLENNK